MLSGWLTKTSSKAAFVRGLGFEVDCPELPSWRLRAAIRMAEAARARHDPHVILGASRGGAIALALPTDRPLILLAPAWRLFRVRPHPDARGIVLQSPHDRLVPPRHSRDLCRRCPGLRLVLTGSHHKLNCPDGRRALAAALDELIGLVPWNVGTPQPRGDGAGPD